MWKTGTSSGRRDAWAVGHNGRVAIGVWVGRFDGGGHATFVGSEAAEPLLATLFALPALRAEEPPRAPASWTVRRPIAAPDEALTISSPHDGTSFLTIDSHAVVHVRAAGRSPDATLHWFLDGQRLEGTERLELEPGRYELRVVDDSGRFAVSAFEVGEESHQPSAIRGGRPGHKRTRCRRDPPGAGCASPGHP